MPSSSEYVQAPNFVDGFGTGIRRGVVLGDMVEKDVVAKPSGADEPDRHGHRAQPDIAAGYGDKGVTVEPATRRRRARSRR